MKITLLDAYSHEIPVDLPCRLNKGDMVYPYNFITEEEAVHIGISREMYNEYKGDHCYVEFICFETNMDDELVHRVYLGDFC